MTDVRDLWYRGLRRVTGILLVAAGSSHPAAAPLDRDLRRSQRGLRPGDGAAQRRQPGEASDRNHRRRRRRARLRWRRPARPLLHQRRQPARSGEARRRVVEPPLPQSRQRRLRGCHREGRSARRGLQHRRGRGGLRQRRPSRSLRRRGETQRAVPQSRRWHVRRRHRQSRHSRRALVRGRRLVRLRRRRLPGPVRGELRGRGIRRPSRSARIPRAARMRTAIRSSTPACPTRCITTTATARLPMFRRSPAFARTSARA